MALPDQDDFPTRNVQSKQSKIPRILCFRNCPPKTGKSQRKQAGGHQVTVSMYQDATHKFHTNILPRNQGGRINQDGHSLQKKGLHSLFSLATGTHLDTPERVQMGDAEAQFSAASPELGVPLSRRTDAGRTAKITLPRSWGGCHRNPQRNFAGTATNSPPTPTHPLYSHTHPFAPFPCAQALRRKATPTSEKEVLVVGTNQVVSVTSIHTPSGANPDLKEFAALILYKHTVSQHMYTNTHTHTQVTATGKPMTHSEAPNCHYPGHGAQHLGSLPSSMPQCALPTTRVRGRELGSPGSPDQRGRGGEGGAHLLVLLLLGRAAAPGRGWRGSSRARRRR